LTDKLQEYARLLVAFGVNVQRGQKLVITCAVDHAVFARACMAIAYERGCAEVILNWTDDDCARQRYLKADDKVFDVCPEWRVRYFTDYAKEGCAFLYLLSEDPQNLLGVDPGRIARATKSSGEALREYRELRMKNENAWTIGALASTKWAAMVFPDLPAAEAEALLWERIFAAVRVNGDGSAVEAWRAHAAKLKERVKILNDYRFKSLHYQNALGTDFVIELAENHLWEAGGDKTTGGVPFMPNLPTEEVFTAPKRGGGSGLIVASMPLSLHGNVIEGIRFVVRDGRIVEATAQKGEETLRNALAVDEGASYFGEIALVPYDSPISRSNTLYYETLFDENAACHFAFGEAYPTNIEGGADMSKDERIAAGLNDSIMHVDFMVGTADLSVVGTRADGTEVVVMQDGNFVF